MKKYWVFKIIKGIVFVSLAIFLFGYITMHLWNWLVPELFAGPLISFCQALGLLVLSKILFGGFGGSRWGKGRCHGSRGHWREKWESKMANMTPEEREKLKQGFYGKCGSYWDKKQDDTVSGS